jgi:hypothetical protein
MIRKINATTDSIAPSDGISDLIETFEGLISLKG